MSKLPIFGVLIIGILLIAGCTQSGTTANQTTPAASSGTSNAPVTPQNPTSAGVNYNTVTVDEFSATSSASGDVKISYDFLDTSVGGDHIPVNANYNISILSSANEEAYQNSGTITTNDFSQCTRALTGVSIGSCYIGYIPASKISSSTSNGKATIQFTLPNNKVLTAKDDYVSLPITVILPPSTINTQIDTYSDPTTYKLSVNFHDNNGNPVEPTGKLLMVLSDQGNTTLYNNSWQIDSSSYTGTTFREINLDIPVSQIHKSLYSYGTAQIIFSNANVSLKDTQKDVSLVEYTDAEKQNLLEQQYSSSAKTINKVITTHNAKYTVVKYGIYPVIDYTGTHNDLRVDFVVQNSGTDNFYFFTNSNIVLVDNQNNQYDSTYGGTLDSKNLLPDAQTSGYMLFDISSNPTADFILTFPWSYYDTGFNQQKGKETLNLGSVNS